tara:strand:+ start:197 stop:1015 length:819 start_codon:yes stop_codon:yes gene_type:complete
MESKFKSTATQQTTPSLIETIFQQNGFDWIYDADSKILSITKIENKIFESYSNDNFSIGIYGWDKQREIIKTFNLGKNLVYPLELNLKKSFENFLGIPRFKLVIFDNKTKAIIKSSKDFIMTDKEQKNSLIKMIPSRIGNKVAELDFPDLEDGPVIYISTDFKTENGTIPFNTLKKIAKTNPFFCMGFWPTVLKQILETAADNPTKDWSQKWFKYVSDLDDVYIQENKEGELEPADNDTQSFKNAITSIIKLFIEDRNFDNLVYSEFNKEDY